MTVSRRSGGRPPILKAISGVHALSETIWTALVDLRSSHETTSVVFTSTEERAGTSLIAASCAMGLAVNTRAEVLLVEANLRRPALAGYFGIEETGGLSDVLAGRASVEEVRRRVPACPGLTVIPAGVARDIVPGEYAAEQAQETIAAIVKSCPFVFFDAPPVLRHSEAWALFKQADYAVLVLRARESRKAEVRKASEMIEASGVELLGAILNRYKSDMPFGPE